MKRITYSFILLLTTLLLTHHNGWSQQKYTWTGIISTTWNEPGNWNPNGVPGISDTIVINKGTCDFSGAGTLGFGGIYFSNGNIIATDTILLNSKMLWTNSRWSGGVLKIAPGSTLTLDDRYTKSAYNCTLVNDGKIIWNGTGNFELTNGAILINNNLIELNNNSSLARGLGNTPKFTNSASGTIRKLNPNTKTILGNFIEFYNEGRVEVQEGLLEIQSPGVYSGSVEVFNGSVLGLGPGSQTWTSTSSLVTNGALLIPWTNGVTVIDFGGILDVAKKTMAYGGITKISGSQINPGDSLIIHRGTFQIDSNQIQIPVISILENGKLVVNAKVTVGNRLDWAYGNIEGNDTLRIPANVAARLYSDKPKILNTVSVVNDGKIIWEDAGNLTLTVGAALVNRNLLEINNNATISRGIGDLPTLYNLSQGIIRKANSAGTTVFGAGLNVNNAGLIDVLSGTLELQSTGVYTGRLKTADSTVLKFTNGIHDFNPGFSLEVAGDMVITGRYPRLNFNDNVVLPPGISLHDIGAIGGSGLITVTDTMVWAGGTLQDTSRFVVDSTGVLILTGQNNNKTLNERNLINRGTMLVKGGSLNIYKNAQINNHGIIRVFDNGNISGSVFGAPFTNHESGRIIVLPGGARMNMGVMHLFNHGYLEINERTMEFSTNYFIGRFTQLDGETRLNKGKVIIQGINLDGGILSGSGTVQGGLTNKGTIDPGIDSTHFGLIYIVGKYEQDTSAVLKIDIGGRSPGSGYDQLTTNTSKLAGLLDLKFHPDSLFNPYWNTKYRVIRWLELPNTGEFDTITNLKFTLHEPKTTEQQLDVVYSPNSLTLYGPNSARDLWFQFVGRRKVRPGNTVKIKMYYSNPTAETIKVPMVLIFFGYFNFPWGLLNVKHYPNEIPWVPPVDSVYFYEHVPRFYHANILGMPATAFPLVLTVKPARYNNTDGGGSGGGNGGGGNGGGGNGGGGNGGGGNGGGGNGGGNGGGGSDSMDFEGTPDCQGPFGVTGSGGSPNDPAMEQCLWDIAELLFDLLPGGDCIKLAIKTGKDVGSGMISSWETAGHYVANKGWDMAKCAVSFIPGAKLVQKTKDIIDLAMTGLDAAGKVNDCANAFFPDDNGNKSSLFVKCVEAKDPNEKVGPEGVTDMRYIKGIDPAVYAIYFENVDSATAPAQNVYITDQLDPNKWDLSTFHFLPITIGDTTIQVPSNESSFEKVVDLRDRVGVYVRISAELNEFTGLITWTFISLDSVTRQPVTDPLAGFLPPNVSHPEGQGDVRYMVEPNADLPSGTPLGGDAVIVFDNNDPIRTNTWINHIENSLPESHMTPANVTVEGTEFLLTWTGKDQHSGIKGYQIYYSVNDESFEKLSFTADTSYMFYGDPCNTYRFYTSAMDSAGNRELPKTPEVEVTINPYLSTYINLEGESVLCSGDSTLLWISYDSLASSYAWYRDGALISQDTAVYVKKGGSYVVDIYRDSTCSFSIGPVIINQDSINAPNISQAENVLSVPDVYASYQWYLDDSPIAGATAASISAKEIGYYKVLVSNLQGCETLSDPFFYQITGLQDPQFNALSVYPNPGTNELYLKFGEGLNKPSTLEMLDISGHIVLRQSIQPLKEGEKFKIDIRTLKPGIYLIRVWNSNNMTLLKFMKE